MTGRPYPLTTRFADALRAASEHHAGQVHKGTTIPYVSHLLGVTSMVLDHGATEDEAVAALLHDAIDAAPPDLGAEWVRRWIRFQFGRRVLAIVEGCTDSSVDPKAAWRERKEAFVRRLARESRSVVLVSVADKLHDALAMRRDYVQIGEDYWTRFSAEAGTDGTLGYYRGLVDAFRLTGHYPELVKQLAHVVDDLEIMTGCGGEWPLPR